jgi:hypothetical protein
MPALQFTRDLADRIRAGKKSQTLRSKLPGNCVIGARLTLQNGYQPGRCLVGHAVIDHVDLIAISDLTETDAVLGGFETLTDLRHRLRLTNAHPVLWRIRWRDFVQTQ